MSTLRQRAVLAAQIKKRNDDEANTQRWAQFVKFARSQMWTALMDMGVDGSPSNLTIVGETPGCALTLSYTEDDITITTSWRYGKYSRNGYHADGAIFERMDGLNPLCDALIAVPCSACGALTGADGIDLLSPGAFVHLGQVIQQEWHCSADCEMQANGHEQFVREAVA